MKKLLPLVILFLASLATTAQTLPIDFESGISISDFVDFDGGTAAIVPNPLSDATNSSTLVGQIIRNGGELYAGSKIILANDVDFTTLTKISMDVYMSAPAGTLIKMKMEGTGNTAEADAVTTTSGSWETLEWIFSGASNELNELVLMFDFGNLGDGTSASTFYFDNIQQVVGPPNPQPVSLPLTFENGTTTSDFRGFAGSTGSVVTNPLIDANNPSATVGKVVKDGGEFWGGSYLQLTNNLDLTTDWVISMKIFTSAPIGTRLKVELEGDSGKSFVDYITTQTSSWETATFNFSGTPSDKDIFILFFDFGNVGDGSNNSTVYFDDVELVSGPAIPAPTQQTFPVTFESGIVDSDLSDFYGAVSEIVANPFPDTVNNSATVGKIVRSGGAPWAQTRIIMDAVMDLNQQTGFSMKVYTDAPIGTTLKFKVHNDGDGFANEQDVLTTVSGAWETYTWDFTGDPSVYDRVTLMLGYDRINNASPEATFYFDDIERVPEVLSIEKRLTEKPFHIYTSSSDNKLHIISTKNLNFQNIRIYNAMGKLIKQEEGSYSEINFNTSFWSAGIYFVQIGTAHGYFSYKFLVSP